MLRGFPVCVLAVVLAASAGRADEIIFNNGDKISGKIVRQVDDQLIVNSAVAGEIKVKMADIKTFSTDEPIEIHLADGTTLKQKVVAADAGKFSVAPGGAVQPQAFPIAQVTKVNPPKATWTGDISAGMLITRGDSYSDLANAGINLQRRGDDDRITFAGQYLYGRTRDPDTGDKSTTTDSWFALGKYDYFLTKKFYVYGQARVEKDRIADLDLRLTAGGGVGYQWVERADFNFSTEGGLTWFYEDYSNSTDTSDHIAARLAYHVDKSFNDNIKVFHNLAYYPSLEDLGDYFITTDAGVRASFTKAMFGEFKVSLDYDSTPAEEASNTNVRYILSVGYSF